MPRTNGASPRSARTTLLRTVRQISKENARPATPSPLAAQRIACKLCKFAQTCLGTGSHDQGRLESPLVSCRRRVQKDEALYRSGAKCDAVYAVRAGFFKTTIFSEDGIGQITGFQMPGDLLGLDGIGAGEHRCDAIALGDGEVCVLRCANLVASSHDSEALQLHILRALCDEISRNQGVMLLLGNRSAEERVAAFVIDFSKRFQAHGHPWSDFRLWMTRAEIGSYLGLELETVSRIFSRLDEQGILAVRGHHIGIRDLDALRKLVGNNREPHRRRRSRGRPSFASPSTDTDYFRVRAS
jgi:CRP/FNR family transcriptional regulator